MFNCGRRTLRINSLALLRCPISLLRLPFSSSPFIQTPPFLNKHEEYSPTLIDDDSPKLFVVQPRLRPQTLLNSGLSEALNLANSLDQQRDGFFSTDFALKSAPPHVVVQNPLTSSSKAKAATYFGLGTIKDIRSHILASESENELDAVFVNSILTGTQQRNLEKAWNKPVLDRMALIIEIFHAHAYTKEAKLQAELAALMYKRSRLVRERGLDGRGTFGGDGGSEVVSARGRGSGGRGFISGAGETELELQRRRISERRMRLLAEIKEVRRTRALQRASRKRHGGSGGQDLATIAVVGYTNAGKSTMVSALSESFLYSDDRLFATVDPRVRGMTLPSGRRVLLSDTVGFVSDLPVQLIEAFHATLEEVSEADLLVHVLDSTALNIEEQRSAVLQVLKQIGVADNKIHNMIEVWNKIDVEENLDSEEYMHDDAEVDTDNLDIDNIEDEDVEESEADIECEFPEGNGFTSEDEEDNSCVQDDVAKADNNIIQFRSENSSHVKTSALTGVGLQELLELIDEKLVTIDDMEESDRNVGKGEFDRKWRPPPRVKKDGDDIAVEA